MESVSDFNAWVAKPFFQYSVKFYSTLCEFMTSLNI